MESGMGFPQMAAWRHRDARVGFEVAFFARIADGLRVDGHTAAVEEGEPFAVRYEIVLDEGFRTRSATIVGRSATGPAERRVEADGRRGLAHRRRRPTRRSTAASTSTSRRPR